MHEMSIIEALVGLLEDQLEGYPGASARTVRLRVGRLRQVEPLTLACCFEAATKGTALAGSRLKIETVTAAVRCPECALEFEVEDNAFECPRCRALGGELLRGNELELTEIEIGAKNEHAVVAR